MIRIMDSSLEYTAEVPMVISLRTLLEYAIDSESGVKRATGNVRSFEYLFAPGVPAYIDRQHLGVYALLLFHPAADPMIYNYLKTGALTSDSGPRVLALYTTGQEARAPVHVLSSEPLSWLELNTEVHPAYSILRILFSPKSPPALPGVLFMGGLDTNEDCVFVALRDIGSESDVRFRIAHVFSLADEAIGSCLRRDKFTDDFAVKLRRHRLTYYRSDRITTRELLLKAFQLLIPYRGDIVTGLKIGMGKP